MAAAYGRRSAWVSSTPVVAQAGAALRRVSSQHERQLALRLVRQPGQREIQYRLLVSEVGTRLREIAAVGSQGHQVARAIEWVERDFAAALRVEELARDARMRVSTFHHHFKALTAMSRLQYRKQLRLAEAQRLMLIERLDAATAAYRVGYESPSQFSREYSRQFGAPPMRDIAGLRARPTVTSAAAP